MQAVMNSLERILKETERTARQRRRRAPGVQAGGQGLVLAAAGESAAPARQAPLPGPPPMFLSIYVHGRLGLTFDVTEDGTRLPEETARHGPAFDRLTADPDMLRHAVRLRRWLAALLPENNTLAAYRLQTREAWERHGAGAAPDSAAAVLWGNADAEYAGAIELRRTGPDAPPELDAPAAGAVEPLTDAEIGRRLGLAARVAEEPQVHM